MKKSRYIFSSNKPEETLLYPGFTSSSIVYTEKTRLILLIILIILELAFYSCKEDPVTPNDPPSGVSTKDYEPAWSPDGHTIAYYHNGDTVAESYGIYLIDTNGSNKRQLINEVFIGSPDFSPDGKWIVFHMGQIFKIKINGDSLTQLTNGERSYYYPSWSPDGEWIAYDNPIVGSFNILKIKKDGSEVTGIDYDARKPSWSRDGSKLTVQKYISGVTFPEIYIIDSNGHNSVRISFNGNWDDYPRFSPDGQKIIFTQRHETNLNFQIYTINTDGSNYTRLTDTQGYTADFSPDGERIVYCDSSPGNGRLWIMNKDGTNKKQLTFP
jgi:Tol biopolymer transport system component